MILKGKFQVSFKPETIAAFKNLYDERKELIEYLEKFGNGFEKAEARLVKEIVSLGSKGCSNVVQTLQPSETNLINQPKVIGDCI